MFGLHGGGGGMAAPSWPPVAISNVALWVRGDQGVRLNGSNVSDWDDQSGNGRHFVNANASQQPLFVASAINGHPAIRGDGSSHVLTAAGWALAQPLLVWLVAKQITWTNGRRITGRGSAPLLFQSSTTPNIAQFAGFTTNANSAWTLNTYKLVEVLFNGAGSYLKVGGTTVSGGNAGTAGYTDGVSIFAGSTGPWNGEIAEYVLVGADPSAGEKTNFANYVSGRYGASLLT